VLSFNLRTSSNRNLSLFFDQIFNSNCNNQFNVYLVGGATLEMMQNKNLYIEKTMQEGELLGNALNQDMAKKPENIG
jgi:hypothetical protein